MDSGPVSVQYMSGLTYDGRGRLQLMPGTLGEMTVDRDRVTVVFTTGQRLLVDWASTTTVDFRGPETEERRPFHDGMTQLEMWFGPLEKWSYLAISDTDGHDTVLKVQGMTRPELQEWIEVRRSA